jgi:hypothetical protein
MRHHTSRDLEEHIRVEDAYRRWYACLDRARQLLPGLTERERKLWLKRLIERQLSELRARARRSTFRVIEGGKFGRNKTPWKYKRNA